MTFKELQNLCEENFGTSKLSDIALELGVSPQVVSNWKSRDNVPYKYVKIARNKISISNDLKQNNIYGNTVREAVFPYEKTNKYEGFELLILIIKETINSIRNNLVLFIIIPVIMSTIALFKVMGLEPIFISYAKIIPAVSSAGSGANSQVQAIAANFGISAGQVGAESITSAKLFPEVIKSRRLFRTLLQRKFSTNKYGHPKTLATILADVDDSLKYDDSIIKSGIQDLEGRIKVSSQFPSSSLITISAHAFESQLAADIANALIDELNKLQILFKTSRVSEKKTFIEGRIQDAEKELTKAEEALKYFRETNRNIQRSPSLLLEESRLMREVSTQMQIFLTLKSQFEIVQIELVEKTNMVDVLDYPEAPVQKSGPNRKMIMIMVFTLSVIFSTVSVYLKDFYFLKYSH